MAATAEAAACIPLAPLRPQTRVRAFRCFGDYRLTVGQGRRGQDPIVGSFGNQKREPRFSQVRTTCAQYVDSTATGTSVCVLWNYEMVEETVTTGVSRPFRLGSAFDAGDIAHSIARTTGDAIVCEIGAKYFGGMELTTEVVDDHTIDITADPAQPILPLLMSTMTVVPSETPMDSFVDTPIGTGPYTFDEYNVSVEPPRRMGRGEAGQGRSGSYGRTRAVSP